MAVPMRAEQDVLRPTGELERDLQVWVAIIEKEHDINWVQADYAVAMKYVYHTDMTPKLSESSGKAPGYIQTLMRTAIAFPPEERAKDLSFSHHRYCAQTANPQYWLEETVKQGWSVHDLQHAIADAKDPVDQHTKAEKAAKTLEADATFFNDVYAPVLGRKVTLSWTPVASS
jgi:hypothetical protein